MLIGGVSGGLTSSVVGSQLSDTTYRRTEVIRCLVGWVNVLPLEWLWTGLMGWWTYTLGKSFHYALLKSVSDYNLQHPFILPLRSTAPIPQQILRWLPKYYLIRDWNEASWNGVDVGGFSGDQHGLFSTNFWKRFIFKLNVFFNWLLRDYHANMIWL